MDLVADLEGRLAAKIVRRDGNATVLPGAQTGKRGSVDRGTKDEPASFSGNGGTSVPPPAKLKRSGAFARITSEPDFKPASRYPNGLPSCNYPSRCDAGHGHAEH